MRDMRPESVVSISSSRKLATRSSMLSMLPVCSPALNMRTTMVGKTGCLASAAEMELPLTKHVRELVMKFSAKDLRALFE